MVFGPWDHGGWARDQSRNAVGNYFGENISRDYQIDVETKFFNHFLKGDGSSDTGLPEAYVYDSGRAWKSYDLWPPKDTEKKSFYLSENQKLSPY